MWYVRSCSVIFGLVGAPKKALRRGLTDFTLCHPVQHGKTPFIAIREKLKGQIVWNSSRDKGYFLSLECLVFFDSKICQIHWKLKNPNPYHFGTFEIFRDLFRLSTKVASEAPEFVDSSWATGRGQSQAATREGASRSSRSSRCGNSIRFSLLLGLHSEIQEFSKHKFRHTAHRKCCNSEILFVSGRKPKSANWRPTVNPKCPDGCGDSLGLLFLAVPGVLFLVPCLHCQILNCRQCHGHIQMRL